VLHTGWKEWCTFSKELPEIGRELQVLISQLLAEAQKLSQARFVAQTRPLSERPSQIDKSALRAPHKAAGLQLLGKFLGGVRRYGFILSGKHLGSASKCGFHQNSTPASAISTRYRVGLGGVAFVPPGAICALLSGAGAV
jgi:hypothetical protein